MPLPSHPAQVCDAPLRRPRVHLRQRVRPPVRPGPGGGPRAGVRGGGERHRAAAGACQRSRGALSPLVPALPPLLQNNGILPLTLGGGSKIQRVAVLGPNGGCAAGQNYPCPAEVATVGHYVSLGAPIQTVVDAVANASAALGFNYTFQVWRGPCVAPLSAWLPSCCCLPARTLRRSARASKRMTRRSSLPPSLQPQLRT